MYYAKSGTALSMKKLWIGSLILLTVILICSCKKNDSKSEVEENYSDKKVSGEKS